MNKNKNQSTTWGDYVSLAKAQESFNYFKNYKGKEILHKSTGEKHIVADVQVHPFTWFENGKELNQGYDIRLYIKNRDFFIKSTAIQTFVKPD